MEQTVRQSKRRSASAARTITDPIVARIVAAPSAGGDGDDAMEVGRTRAAALAWWLQQHQNQPGASSKLGVVLMEMSRAPAATRHAFMEHLAHLLAIGSEHIDLNADLAQQNAAPRGFDLLRKL